MYTKIINPIIDIYDADTGEFEVTLAVELPHSQEDKLLNLLNRGELFSDLFIINAEVINARQGYEPPTVEHPRRRVGVLRLLARDDAGTDVPVEIRMYKEKRFAVRPLAEVLEDFHTARKVYPKVDKVFLADGDALVRRASELATILDTVRELFPECQRVTCYASPSSIRVRTDEELEMLRVKGLSMSFTQSFQCVIGAAAGGFHFPVSGAPFPSVGRFLPHPAVHRGRGELPRFFCRPEGPSG